MYNEQSGDTAAGACRSAETPSTSICVCVYVCGNVCTEITAETVYIYACDCLCMRLFLHLQYLEPSGSWGKDYDE